MRAVVCRYVVIFVVVTFTSTTVQAQGSPFVRGDVHQDGSVDILDPVGVLLHLFGSFEAPCEKAADVDDSGVVDLSDAIYELEFLFRGGSPPPAPFGICGLDPSPDALSCEQPPCDDASYVSLSEILASNVDSLLDEDGDSSDWIEIQVAGSAPFPVDLGGWHLTDDPALSDLWQLPHGLTLEPGGFLVIFASGKDRAAPGSELHTSFRLAAEGEYLALVAPDGRSVVDEFVPAYPEQLRGVSYGTVRSTATLVRPGDPVLYRVPTAADSGVSDAWMAPGFNSTGWTSGTTGLGFTGVAAEGFEVTCIKASIEVDHITLAEQVLSSPALQSWVATESASVIDYFNGGESGNYPGDHPFPGVGSTDEDDFVVLVSGRIVIPQTGTWSFGVNSDEGFRLELTNGTATHSMEHPTPRAPTDTIQAFHITEAGTYDLRLLFYEHAGGAELELFAAPGFFLGGFNPTSFRLVGDLLAGGLGFQDFAEDVETDLADEMLGVNASLWQRFDFTVADAHQLGELTLRMKYQDGFVAWINGQEVARRNAPAFVSWNSTAASERPLHQAVVIEEIDLSEHLEKLTDGSNVLAIQGLNDSPEDPGFLVLPELVAVGRNPVLHYMPVPTPGAINQPGAVDFVRPVDFSVERGFFDASFPVSLSTSTVEAEIRYTLDGSTPTATSGSRYDAPFQVTGTSVLRAAAFKPDHLGSAVTTKTWIFVSDVAQQSPSGQTPGPGWPTGSVNRQILDYGMDPDIVNSPQWSGQIADALLAIPSISLVTDLENLFDRTTGIYVNAGNDGRAWERRTSVELLHPDGTEGFGVDAGLRIRGAVSRSDSNPKHAFRLIFRNDYGAGKLEHPLFGGEGVDEFDKVDLRTSQNYSWAFDGSDKNTFIREVFSRDVQRDMGQPYTRSRYYHLYLNGQYWGIYQTQERADADFAASYLGGQEEDYDVIKNDSSGTRALQATNGTMEAYRRLYDAAVAGFSSDSSYRRVLGLLPDGTPDPDGEVLVDPENLMDYMICTYYTGDPDAPVSAWAHFSNNVFAIYDREEPAGFTWYRHDAEHSLGAHGGLFEDRLLTDFRDRSIGEEWRHFNPAWLHLRLTAHPEYLLQFADRVHRYFSQGGILSSDPNIERWMARADRIDLAIIAESARWGDSKRHPPFTRSHWLNESSWLVDTFFPQRTQIVLGQMRSVGMFPQLGLVSFNQHGGPVDPGFQVLMTQGNGDPGTIYYTLDGTDPRQWGGGIRPGAQVYPAGGGSPILLNGTTTVRARLHDGSSWGALTEARFTVGLEGLVINELMASNAATLEDPVEPGEFPDWLELYNGTADTIDLGGLYLTDDLLELTHWQIAPGVTLGPGEFLVIYADDDGTQGPLHTNFQLSRNGEAVALVDADGTTILDVVVFDLQEVDVSFGRSPDGAEAWGFLQSPTPGAANTGHRP